MKNRELRNMMVLGIPIILAAALFGAFFIGATSGLLSLLSGAALLAIFIFLTNRQGRQLEQLNAYLVRVLNGGEMPEIDSQEEGELSILRSNIYKAAMKLQTQNERLAEDKTKLSEALADISHQLKTPLTSMMVMNDLLSEEEDSERREEFLRTQSAQLTRMNWLIQTLLKISRLDAGTIELKKENVSDEDLIEEALKPFLIQFDVRSITYEQTLSGQVICCDKNWTVEALQNIIKNCMEHTENGGALSLSTTDTNIYSQITIRDRGCGIAPEDLPHIFERFYKGKNGGKDSVGIGLALAKRILELENGEIMAESTVGVGTTFTVRLYKTII